MKIVGVGELLPRSYSCNNAGPMQTRLEVSRSRGFSKFVGRSDELATLEATLERALVSIVDNLGAEAGSIWLVDEDGLTLTCRASVGPHQITGTRLSVNEGIIGRSVRQNLCQSVFDVTQESSFNPGVVLRQPVERSVIASSVIARVRGDFFIGRFRARG